MLVSFLQWLGFVNGAFWCYSARILEYKVQCAWQWQQFSLVAPLK